MPPKKAKSRKFAKPRKWMSRRNKKGQKMVRVRSLVIPRAQFIRIVDYFQGYVPNGAVTNGFATIYAGQLLTPYNTGAPITASNFGSLIPTTGNNINDNFIGYPIINSQYTQYKVYGSKLTMVCRPEGSSDTIQFGAFPWASAQQTTITSLNVDEYNEQPYCRSKICYSQKASDSVSLKTSPATVLGMTKLQYKVTGDQNQLAGVPQTSMNYNYLVYWRTLDNQNVSANVIFSFKLERYVQFYGPNVLYN